MARVPPSAGQWSAFYARLCRLIALLIWLNEPFALEFCGGREVRVPGVIKDAVGWSVFCRCDILVSSNAGPPSMSLWMRSLLISRGKNLILNG